MDNTHRDLRLDYLKFIGIICLFIAHTVSNRTLMQIRNFDVNLLVILSAILVSKSNIQFDSLNSVFFFYKKRFFRLVIPTWIFITLYFIINLFFHFSSYTKIQIIRSYLLQNNSIGYVWIIYVYMLCALLVPILVKINLKLYYLPIILGIYTVLSGLSNNYYYGIIILYPIAYGFLTLLGLNWEKLKNSQRLMMIIFFGIIFLFCLIFKVYVKESIFLGDYKYPPKLYYLSYTIFISLLLLFLMSKVNIKYNLITKGIIFINSHSLWLYLWHILVINILEKYFNLKAGVILFIFTICISIMLIIIQNQLINYLKQHNIKFYRILLG